MRRRDLLLASGAALALPAAGRLLGGGGGGAPLPWTPGLQLYTLRSLMAADLAGTLRAVADIGYREVEFAGYFGLAPDRIQAILREAGLAAPSAHVALEALEGAAARPTLDAAQRIGHEYVVVAWVAAALRRTPDDWQRLADRLNRVGETARAAGLRFAYHNHDFEFAPAPAAGGDRVGYDLLLDGTDPGLVALELDLYWIVRGGGDPARYFDRWPGRFPMVHVKDMDATAARGMADPGTGIIDFPALFARAAGAGIRHAYVEHDQPADPLATARAGYRYLSRLAPPPDR